VGYVQGFPKRGSSCTKEEVWTGPESVFRRAGFRLERDHPSLPVYGLSLKGRRRRAS
jgi:hypothetical protein